MPSHHAKQMQAKKSSQTVENLPATVWVGPRGRGARQTVLTPELPSPSMSTHRRRMPNTEAAWCWFEERKKSNTPPSTIHPIQPTTKQLCARLLLFTHRSLAGRVISHLSGMGSVAGGWFVIRFLPPCMPLSVLVIFIAGVLVLVRENFSFSPHGWFTLGLH